MIKATPKQGQQPETAKASSITIHSCPLKAENTHDTMDNWMHYDQQTTTPLNANELTSLTALIAYVAHISGQNEFRVERLLADRFNIPNIKCLSCDHYDDAIVYLVDQVPSAATV